MSLALLDGTSGNVDVQITIPGGSATSFKCVIGAVEYRCTRSFTDIKTLCSGKWIAEAPQNQQDFITISKFASKGTAVSDTSVLLASLTPVAVTVTLETLCTKIGTYHFDSDTYNVTAGMSAIPGQLTGRSSGSVATAWVTS